MKIKKILAEIVKFKYIGKKEWEYILAEGNCPSCKNTASITYQNNIYGVSFPLWWYCGNCRIWGKFKKKKYDNVKSHEELI